MNLRQSSTFANDPPVSAGVVIQPAGETGSNVSSSNDNSSGAATTMAFDFIKNITTVIASNKTNKVHGGSRRVDVINDTAMDSEEWGVSKLTLNIV